MKTINKLIISCIFLSMVLVAMFSTATVALACGGAGQSDYTWCDSGSNAVYWFTQCDQKLDLYKQCASNQTCPETGAKCIDKVVPPPPPPPTIICSTNSQCGTDGAVGDLFCQGGNVYQNYKTYTCNNPGTATSSCSNSTVAQLKTTCSGNQICTNGSCGNTCTPNYQQKCLGTSMYWFDSCGTQGAYVGSCGNTCTPNYQQKCLGTSMYWFDSCGMQGSYIGSCGQTNSTLTVIKTVKDLTTNTSFASSTYANPSDMVMFMITLQAGGSDAQNVFVRDTLPVNLIYNNQLVVARTNNNYNNYSGDIISGLNLSTISAGQTVTITYQAQVAQSGNFVFGTTTLNNLVNTTSSNVGYIPTASASVIVTKATVLGASTVSTGLTNNFWVDSFFLPLLLTLIGIWMWRTGMFFGIEKWLDGKRKVSRGHRAEKELSARIANIQNRTDHSTEQSIWK